VRILCLRIGHGKLSDVSRARSSLPMYALKFAVNQMFPSLSATSPCGPELGVFSGNSLNVPVLGSSRPSLFAIWPVHQSAPSRATAGSCGSISGSARHTREWRRADLPLAKMRSRQGLR
jgi:hypothetical protein